MSFLLAERTRSECARLGQERVSARSGWAGENVERSERQSGCSLEKR